jgi:hypothetical protein
MAQATLKIDEKAKTVTITLPLEEGAPSNSGKNIVIASTHGTASTDVQYKGKVVRMGVNVFYKPEKAGE